MPALPRCYFARTERLLALALASAVGASALAGCGDDDVPLHAGDSATDPGEDAGADSAPSGDANDTQNDAPTGDAPDAGDARSDTGSEADTRPDAEADTRPDSEGDTDAGADTGPDSGVPWPSPPDTSPLGDARPADVLVPRAYTVDREWPLVVLLHGYGASGLLQRAYLGLPALVDSLGFVLLTPNGTIDSRGKNFWNAWTVCCDFGRTGVDDVAYLSGLLDEAATRFRIDPTRVYFIGHSNGGYMSYRMACELGPRVAGIMSLAGAMPADLESCADNGPVAVLQIHGTEDDSVPYESQPPGRVGAIDSAAFWAERGGCDSEPTVGERLDIVVGAEAETAVTEWQGCERDVAVWTLEGVGHLPAVNANFSRALLEWLFARPAQL